MNTVIYSIIEVRKGQSHVVFACDFCGDTNSERISHFERKGKHFCDQRCYAGYVKTLPPEQQNGWRGGGYEAHKRWVSRNPARMAHLKARRYAREKGAEGSHTLVEWEALKELFDNKCVGCGERKPLTKDHVEPLSKGGSDYIGNIQPLCRNCNSRKWAA